MWSAFPDPEAPANVGYSRIALRVEPDMPDADSPVRQCLAAYQAAVLAKDVDAFVAIYADDARFFGHLSARQRRDLMALLQQLVSHHQLEQVPVA